MQQGTCISKFSLLGFKKNIVHILLLLKLHKKWVTQDYQVVNNLLFTSCVTKPAN